MQIICRGKIEEIKLNNYSTVEDFCVDFEKTINEFKTARGKIDELEKLRYLLRALPPSYSFIGDFFDVIPDEQRTVDYCNALPVERLAVLKKTAGMVKRIIMDIKAFKEDTNRAKVSEVCREVAVELDSTEVAAEAEVILELDHRTTLHPNHGQLKHVQIVEENTRLICLEKLNDIQDDDSETEQTSNVSSEIVKTEYESYLLFKEFCEQTSEEPVPQLKFYEEIKLYEKQECPEERRRIARNIYDNFIMKELLAHSHVSPYYVFGVPLKS
ncbi:G protein-coupled receptor kinase 1 [Eumeta japonica]|uniref:G protein-coupled receptor kinase 1 n=1 Tax=Eumeta variegata TaxID=151549 RepID=A0A4C1UIL3_EUMVA|nr:G protein-coupled receptor kinase 1 [Eumeta japonica]